MLEDGAIVFLLPVGVTDLAIVENVVAYYRAHTASYPMGTASSYSGRKAVILYN
jgi:hypothetical protein